MLETVYFCVPCRWAAAPPRSRRAVLRALWDPFEVRTSRRWALPTPQSVLSSSSRPQDQGAEALERDGKPAAKFATRCWIGGPELEKLLDSLNAEQLERITWLHKPPDWPKSFCARHCECCSGGGQDHLVQAAGSRC